MRKSITLWCAVLFSIFGCTSAIPYRDGQYVVDMSCGKVYSDYDSTLMKDAEPTKIKRDDRCWTSSRETHQDFDLLFVEFDDQGWVQGAHQLRSPQEGDQLSKIYGVITEMHKAAAEKNEKLTLVVFVHGWQHSADALDVNVHSFRKLLSEVAQIENAAAGKGAKTRVVGIYVGWRGMSITIPLLREFTFWERKNTAERVAQGSVQELLRWLDLLRDSGRDGNGNRNVKMLTIGHSFGGLIAFESLNGELLRNAVRFKKDTRKKNDDYMSRVGDLVIIVNPAFEGARYEPLHAAGHRLFDRGVERNQLPVLIIATSKADKATRCAFPIARAINTVFESMSSDEWWGQEWQATVKTVGHNERYITHELSKCDVSDETCKKAQEACEKGEYAYIGKEIVQHGFDASHGRPSRQYLCNGLDLRWTKEAFPDNNPFWVVRTTKDIMKDHNNIFNPAMISFVRQMYIAFIIAQREAVKPVTVSGDSREK